jgi:YesN/AraC family two-component response regulator
MEFSRIFYHRQQDGTQQRLKKAATKNFCHAGSGSFHRLFSILNAIFNEFTNRQEDYIEAIRAHLDLFFIEYIRQSHNRAGISTTAGGYQQQRFEELMELIESKITQLKNVTDYAALLSLSTYQLNAITKTSVGKTVSDLISEQIILEAKRHLLATTDQVNDIANHLGYEDASYFIRFFKKHTGYTPDVFRKNFK